METGAGRWRIVVGVDGSDGSRHALDWARDEALLRGAELHVVHAWSPPAPVSEIAALVEPVDAEVFEKAAHELLTGEVDRLAARPEGSPPVEAIGRRGYASTILLEESKDANLLVVGTRGRGGFTGLLLGSVSQQCAQHTELPLAVIPATAPTPGTGDVVVGVDGSEGSWAALRWAVDEAGMLGVLLSVVHAWWTPFAVPPGGIGIAPLHPRDFREQSERLLHEMVDGTVTRAERPPPGVELLSVEEPAAPALLHRARGAGVLVVGSRGRGGFAGLLLGSVSQQCMHHATSAIVVVPHRG